MHTPATRSRRAVAVLNIPQRGKLANSIGTSSKIIHQLQYYRKRYGLALHTDPAHSHKIPHTCIHPVRSHLSRALAPYTLASIPCARVDPAPSHQSRALVSIPRACVAHTRIDPAHSHRSRTLASIPRFCVDPARSR